MDIGQRRYHATLNGVGGVYRVSARISCFWAKFIFLRLVNLVAFAPYSTLLPISFCYMSNTAVVYRRERIQGRSCCCCLRSIKGLGEVREDSIEQG
jgi:hypothetical protein